ncbi:Histidyl-tRNA synthetase [Gulosibacter sp. 10]|nr:Histidyl-tRNA synthetase [Gulosibacter sp. 10]
MPADKRRRERVLAKIRTAYAAHGFDEIETPVVEDSARLHSGMGGDNEKLSFAILRRGIDREALAAAAEGGDPLALSDLGLRFDLTVPLARFVATHRGTLPAVFRSLQIGPVWRAERPQKGRYRQFVQCDIDILGEAGALAEAELLVAGSAALASLGLDTCTIRVNDRRLLNALLDWCGFAEAEQPGALISIDKLDKIGAEGVVAELAETSPAAAERIRAALAGWAETIEAGIPLETARILDALPEGLREQEAAVAAAESLGGIAEAVAAGGGALPLVFDPTLVRGMGYYTGTIFEVAHPESGSSVGGGGRYDGMIGRFLGQDVPACGFSIGFERIVDLVRELEGGGEEAVLALVDKKLPIADTMRVKRALLKPGRRVRIERRPKNVRNLLDRAAGEGFTHVAHIRAEHVEDPAGIALEPLEQ